MNDIIVIGKNDCLRVEYSENKELENKIQEAINTAIEKSIEPSVTLITVEVKIITRAAQQSLMDALKNQKAILKNIGVDLIIIPNGTNINIYKKDNI